jgi:acyl carrier protein
MDDLKTFIQHEIANLAFKKVSVEESLVKSNLLDSITMVELMVSIEERIGKRFPQHLINDENFETINTIIETVNKI